MTIVTAELREIAQLTTDHKWPSPLDAAAFHGLVGAVVRAIEPESEADPAALYFQFLCAFGSMIGRSARYRVEGDDHRGNIFIVLVGATSTGRKGTSWGQIRRLVEGIDPEWFSRRILSGLSSGEGLIWSVRDAIQGQSAVREHGRVVRYETMITDPGVPDKRALIVESEFSSPLKVMAREGNTLSAVLREAWDRGDLRILSKNTPAHASGAHISLIGHIGRGELSQYLNSTEMGNGFANRIIWVCARRSKPLPDGGNFRIADHPDLTNRLKAAVEFSRGTHEVRRDQEASEIWRKVYRELSEPRPGLFGAIIGRAPAQVVRLSVLFALLDCSAVVGRKHILAALAAWKYAEDSALYVFGASLGYPVADKILSALRLAPNGLSRTQINNLFGRNLSEVDIRAALNCLAEHSLAYCCEVETGGRSSEIWFAGQTGDKATK
jgi:hypothetical protein